MPLQLYGRHSLEAYGYRLGEYKGNFHNNTDWSEWSQEMGDYCVKTLMLPQIMEHFLPYLNGYVRTSGSRNTNKQEIHGWYFDESCTGT